MSHPSRRPVRLAILVVVALTCVLPLGAVPGRTTIHFRADFDDTIFNPPGGGPQFMAQGGELSVVSGPLGTFDVAFNGEDGELVIGDNPSTDPAELEATLDNPCDDPNCTISFEFKPSGVFSNVVVSVQDADGTTVIDLEIDEAGGGGNRTGIVKVDDTLTSITLPDANDTYHFSLTLADPLIGVPNYTLRVTSSAGTQPPFPGPLFISQDMVVAELSIIRPASSGGEARLDDLVVSSTSGPLSFNPQVEKQN